MCAPPLSARLAALAGTTDQSGASIRVDCQGRWEWTPIGKSNLAYHALKCQLIYSVSCAIFFKGGAEWTAANEISQQKSRQEAAILQ